MQRRHYLRELAVLGGSVAIAGCSEDSSSTTGGTNTPAEDENEEEEEQVPAGTRWYDSETGIGVMNGVEAELDSIDNMYIRGAAENFSETDYDYVQLSFAVYDGTDAKIADGLANTSGLPAGQTWRFEALAPGADGAESYKLTGVTAY